MRTSVYFFLSLISAIILCVPISAVASTDPVPTPWPLQFHSLLVMNSSYGLQVADLWYDWPNGRNFNILQNQLGSKRYDVQWNNGSTYYFTLDDDKVCTAKHFSVGILRPNWLDGANYLGQEYKDGFLCNVWEKIDFVWYYEDVITRRPVFWAFYTGVVTHVMTFEVGRVLDDPNWQAPVYCFEEAKDQNKATLESPASLASHWSLTREILDIHIPMVL